MLQIYEWCNRPDIMKRQWAGHSTPWAVWVAPLAGSERWLVGHGYLGDFSFLKGQWWGCPVCWTFAKTVVATPYESEGLCGRILRNKTMCVSFCSVTICGVPELIYHYLCSSRYVSQVIPKKGSKLFNGTQSLTMDSYNTSRGFFLSSGTKSMFHFT